MGTFRSRFGAECQSQSKFTSDVGPQSIANFCPVHRCLTWNSKASEIELNADISGILDCVLTSTDGGYR